MVAPCEVGEPMRSFVLVSTKGENPKRICWDLARCSQAVAAAAPMHHFLPRIHLQPQLQPQLQPRPVLVTAPNAVPKPEQVQVPSSRSPPAAKSSPRQQTPATGYKSKRPREEEEEQQEKEGEQQEEGRPQPVTKVAKTTNINTSVGASRPQNLEVELLKLRQVCYSLQRKNENLQRRLGLFHNLFQDKQRLNSFVQYLNTTS